MLYNYNMRLYQQWIDHTGKIYNYLKCIKRLAPMNGRTYWQVECILCNKIKNVDIAKVLNGHDKSCGCLPYMKKELIESVEIWGKKQLYSRYKHSAKKSNRTFELTFEDFCNIVDLPCAYCGESKTQKFIGRGFPNRIVRYNGIDRFDNRKGYTRGNCMPCCIVCNRMKLTMPYHKFFTQINKIHNNFSRLKL